MWSPFMYFNLPEDFLTSFVKSQFTALPYPTHSFTGQTIIITGSNIGLGLEASRHFVRLGAAKVILGVRTSSKGLAAKELIKQTTKGDAEIEVWTVDLTSYASVKEFCAKAETLERLDVVVENAGLATPVYEEKEGMESTITVNVISTFLMALLLSPKLRESGIKYNFVPRLVIVASDAHNQARFVEKSAPEIFPALKNPQNQSDKYNISKLLEILFIRSLAPALSASRKPALILNTLTPGFCHSALMRHAAFPLNVLGWVGKLILARTTEVGSRTLVAAAAAGQGSHGEYMVDCKVGEVPVSRWVRSEEGKKTQERVYKELLAILEEIEPGISENI